MLYDSYSTASSFDPPTQTTIRMNNLNQICENEHGILLVVKVVMNIHNQCYCALIKAATA